MARYSFTRAHGFLESFRKGVLMYMIVYYKIKSRERGRHNLQHCSMRPPFDNYDEFSLSEIAEWHLLGHELSKESGKEHIIEECGWEYPGKDKKYVVMEQHTYEGKWSPYMTAHTRFLTRKDAEKVLEDTKNWKSIMAGENRFLIKEYSSKRYPNIILDHKFTQEQVENKMHEIFKSVK